MRQRSSRRVRPRPNSRGNENLTSPISCTEPSSPFDQSNDISSGCSNAEKRLPELPNEAANNEHQSVNERRTRSERYIVCIKDNATFLCEVQLIFNAKSVLFTKL